jgi:hypothetical protein
MMGKLTLFLILSLAGLVTAQEGGAQTCVSTFAQATCMGPWFGWNEPSHLTQGDAFSFLQLVFRFRAMILIE